MLVCWPAGACAVPGNGGALALSNPSLDRLSLRPLASAPNCAVAEGPSHERINLGNPSPAGDFVRTLRILR